MLVAVELVRDRATKEPTPDLTARVLDAAKARGLIVGKGGLHANVLRINLPLIVTRSDCDAAVEALDGAFADVMRA